MKNNTKTKEQLLVELDKLNKKIVEQKSENFSKQILESITDGFSILDETGVHLNVNRALCKMTGFTKKELIGTGPPHPYWPEEEYNNIQEAFVKTLQGNFSAFELVFKKKNGKRFPVLVTPAQVKDKKGNVISNFATVVDITKRKMMESMLNESEEKFRKAFEYASVGRGISSIEGKFIDANKTFYKMLGYSKKKFLDLTWQEITYPDDLMKSGKYVKRLLEGAIPSFRFVHRLLHKEGHIIWVDLNVVLIRNEKDRPLYLVGDIIDITEQKQKEDMLYASKQRYQAMLNANTNIVGMVNREGIILSVNDTAARRFGKNAEELIGTNMYDLFPSEVAKIRRKKFNEVFDTGKSVNFEDQRLDIIFENTFFPIFNQKGKVDAVAVYAVDITEQKQLQQKLAQASEEWQSTYDATNDVIWIIDKDHHVVRSNKAAEQLFNKPKKELVGKFCYEIVHCTNEPIPECPFRRMEKSLKRETMELRMGEKWLMITVDPILDENNKFTSAVHIIRDITERKQAEEEIKNHRKNLEKIVKKRTNALEEKNAELDRAMKVFVGREITIRNLQKRIRAIEGKD